MLRRALIVLGHSALDHGSTLDGVDDAGELDQRAIAHELDDAAMEFLDRGVDQFAAAALQSLQRADLIFAHEAAVADHVGSKYCGKPSLHMLVSCLVHPSSFANKRIDWYFECERAWAAIDATTSFLRPLPTWVSL